MTPPAKIAASPAHNGAARSGTLSGTTEACSDPEQTLLRLQDRFVALWAQMAPGWGIARAMGEVHALLFIVGEPLNTDDVIERLGISRGSASMTLRRLEEWGMVDRESRPGDRKEYFTAEQDVWKMLRTIVQQRKKRELDPLLEALAACRHSALAPATPSDASSNGRTAADHELLAHDERVTRLIELFERLDGLGRHFVNPRGGRGLEMAARLLERARLDRGLSWLLRSESRASMTPAVELDRTADRSARSSIDQPLPLAGPSLGLRIRWTGCMAGGEERARGETAVVVELRLLEKGRGRFNAWTESPKGRQALRHDVPVTVERYEADDRLHLDAFHDGMRLAAISLEADRLVFARSPVLAEAGLGAGALDPPALELIADAAPEAAHA